MRIAGLTKSSLIDFPGKIAAVVFVSGCNYDCFYCHNRALLDGRHEAVKKSEVVDFLHSRRGLLDGVVISGGEPTLNSDLPEFIGEVRALGFAVKLDTNGSNPAMVRRLAEGGLIDYVSVDYKTPGGDYRKFCGSAASYETTLQTISFLVECDFDFEVRTTLIPQIGEGQLVKIAGELPKLPRYVINRFRIPDSYRMSDEALLRQPAALTWDTARIKTVLSPIQPNVII